MSNSSKKNNTDYLADWVFNFSKLDVPEDIYETVKLIALDTLGAMLFATKFDLGKRIIKFAQKIVSRNSSYIFGVKPRVNPPLAGLIGGTLGHGDELDEVHLLGGGHLAASIVPTGLCMADYNDSSVKDFLHSILIGYEVAGNLATAMGRITLKERNFHASGIVGAFGCVACACKLMKLVPKKIVDALALTASQASGTIAWHTEKEHRIKSFQVGLAARNAITATLLAIEGFSGPKSVFDGPYNIFQTFAGIKPPLDWLDNFGMDQVSHAAVKKYSAGRPLQAVLDALSYIEKETLIDPMNIEYVNVYIPPETAKVVDSNLTFSIDCQSIVAKALMDGVNSLVCGNESNLDFNRYKSMIKKVSLVYDSSLSRHYPENWPAIIRIQLSDGKQIEKEVINASGSKGNPMSKEEILSKFNSLSLPVLGEKRVQAIIKLINTEEESIRELTNILTIS